MSCFVRSVRIACACVLPAMAATAMAADWPSKAWQPSAVFVQAGAGRQVQALAMGARWDWDWVGRIWLGRVTGSTEFTLARWRAHDPSDDFTQVGITPVLRLYPRGWQPGWFLEAGIGANAITPHYRNRGDRFSTVFNFGDHLGVGRRFGPAQEHELVLRAEHFSNCSLREPNPGENFLQVRYLRRF